MFSASQAKTARACASKWAFQRTLPKPPDTPEQAEGKERGKAIHLVAENYHNHGTSPDRETEAGKIFLAGLPFLPRPGVGRTEVKLECTIGSAEWVGYIDLLCQSDDLPGAPPGMPAILDYKSTKKLEYVLAGEGQFLNDEQAIIYALWVMMQTGAERVFMRWLGLKTVGRPKAKCSDYIMTREAAIQAFDRVIEPVVSILVPLGSKPDPLALRPNPSECRRYGEKYKCPYEALCHPRFTPAMSLGGIGEYTVGLLDEMKAERAAAQVKTAVMPPSAGVNPPEAASKPSKKPAMVTVTVTEGPTNEEIGRVVRFLLGR